MVSGVGVSVFFCGAGVSVSGVDEFVPTWEVYIEIVDSLIGSGVVTVIACINDLSARFAATLVAVVRGNVPTVAKNDSVFSEIGVKGVNWFSSIIRVSGVPSGYSLLSSGYPSLGWSSES